MINNLPKSLIESAKSIISARNSNKKLLGPNIEMGIRDGRPKKMWGPNIEIGIRDKSIPLIECILTEAIQDWFKSTGRKNPHDYSDLAEEHFANLNNDEINSIKAYTYDSKPIKEHIENDKDGPDVHIDEGVHANIKHIDSALSKNILKNDLITYSGLRHHPLENNDSYAFVHAKSYISSTIDPVVAHKFALSYNNPVAHIARIHNKKGRQGLYIGHNNELTHSPSEFEYIMPRETTFRLGFEPEEIKDQHGNVTHNIWDFYRE